MAIRLGNSCANCENLSSSGICSVHKVQVNDSYTCDTFEMKSSLKDDMNCGTCSRHETANCANPEKASIGMLCSHWAPQTGRA